MNTLDITRLDDQRVRVTIRSEGERDQHVDLTHADLMAAAATAMGDLVYRDPEPPAVGEPPTTTPGADE
jgi:hypothetical protein